MSSRTNYMNDFYKQFEELNEKLDNLLSENKELKKNQKIEIKKLRMDFKKEREELKLTIENLTKQLKEANELNKKLQNEIDRLKNQLNKDSTNSSKPSSTNIVTPKKKTGANLYNYRTKSNKKIGGQKGHQGYNLSKEKVEELIKNNKIEVRVINHTIKGKRNIPTVKYRIGIETNTYVEKHIFNYNQNVTEILPKEFYTDVTYDSSIKTLSIELGAYNLIPYDRLSEFFSVITNNIINISKGTLVNFLYEFSSKGQLSLINIENNILNEEITKTDETSTKYNKQNLYIRNYSNSENVLYKAHENKGHKPIREDGILTRFIGGIIGDHDTTLYKYGSKNYECNIHLGRYLEELIQNIKEVEWPKEMKTFLFELKEIREKAREEGREQFSKNELNNYYQKYDEILNNARSENKDIKSSFYKDKALKLYRRLIKYKENHLGFIKDFNVSFDNNESERDLRFLKTKTKVSGGFRSMVGAEHYTNALSIINTAKKRNINPSTIIKAIFNNEILFA